MPLQPRYATPWPQGKREPMAPTAAKIIADGDPGREPFPETVDVPRCRMTRHAGDGGSFNHPRRSRGISPGRPLAVIPDRTVCAKLPLLPCPPGLLHELVPSVARGYNMLFSGGFLFRPSGSAGVQNVVFAGVFVPQVWNQQGYQSASRSRPVGARLRLYHHVLVPC